MKKEYILSIVYDTSTEEIESITEAIEEDSDQCLWFDTGKETLKIPKGMLKYIDSNILGIS
tara:strand:- start:184 stop:366 length:183 start_codon:yes stop_codon:yes gene_type:complete